MSGERRLIIDVEDDPTTVADPDVTLLEAEGHRLVLAYDPSIVATDKLIGRIASKYRVRDIFVENPPIDEIIARYYTSLKGDGGKAQ